MTADKSGNSDHYALLIGVDCYLPHTLRDGTYYPSLSGCVPDVRRVESFLKTKVGIGDDHVFKLTATNTGSNEPPEPKEQWPTYRNMVTAFQALTDLAQPGDQVYVHYSGHGGRQETNFPELKGETATDEGLVPMDISTSQYLLDVELAHIFKQMADKDLILTVALDCCHSGGAARGLGKAAVRGISTVDRAGTAESLVAPANELAATWRAATRGQTRAFKPGGGWLPEPEDYVLLAACRPHEYAHEYDVEPGQRGGVLTYWLLDSLKQIGPGLNYEMVHHRVLAKVHGTFSEQAPQLQGQGSRVVFGSDMVLLPQAVTVMQVDEAGERVELATGQAQGVRSGTLFAVYPSNVADLSQVDQRLAMAAIEQLGSDQSWARITHRFSRDPIEQGAQAVLLDPGSVRLRRTVALFNRDDVSASVDQAAALAKVESALPDEGQRWVTLAGEDDTVDYQVVVSEQGEYAIWDRAGKPIANLRPALKVSDEDAAGTVVRRLVHLTKYHNILLLDNHDATSPLARALDVELMRAQADYVPGDPMELQPIEDPGGTPTLAAGEPVFLRIRNRSSRVLNVTVLNLRPDWGISQVHPYNQDYDTLDPGAVMKVRLQVGLPEGYKAATDLLKVFATVGPASYRWLELPALDRPHSPRGIPTNPLEMLMAALTAEQAGQRTLTPVVDPSHEWSMAQLEVHVQKADPV